MLLSQTLSLLQQVKELELIAKKNTTGLLAGNYLSAVLGHGMEFHEARKYVQGESIRLIDWNMTARLGDVYVKKLREEREREIFLAVDVSPSMFFGTQNRTKMECAMEVAATLGYSAITGGDKLGMVSFHNQVTDSYRPRKGRSHLFAILKSLMGQKNRGPQHVPQTNIASAINYIQELKGRKFIVYLISDFIEHDIPEDLRLIQDRHDVVMIHIHDPLEYEASKNVFLPFFAPEGKKHTASLNPGACGHFSDIENFLKGSSLKYGIDVVSIVTNDLISKKLILYFREKKQRRVR